MSSSELKRLAKDQINGNTLMLFVFIMLPTFLFSAIVFLMLLTGVGLFLLPILLLFFLPFEISIIHIFQRTIKNGTTPPFAKLFSGYKVFDKAVLTYLLRFVYLFLWSLLFFVPAIIKYFSYFLAPYIIEDDKTISANNAITKSREMMDGHKWELFWLLLTFIGWDFLVSITSGLASIYVYPYKQATLVNFYNYCKAEYNAYNKPAPGIYDTWTAPVSEPVWNAPSSEPVWNAPASEPVWNAPDAESQRTTLQPPKSL